MIGSKSLEKRPLGKNDLQPRIAAAWSRVISKHGKGTFADKLGCCTATIDNALTGPGLPEAHTLLNSLLACPTALDEVLRLYSLRIVPLQADAANDLNVAAGMSEIATAICRALTDGSRNHTETLAIANLIRPHLPALTALVRDADVIRGVA